MKIFLVLWHDFTDGYQDNGVKAFNTYNEASDFYNSKIDDFYAGIDDGSDYNNQQYTEYVTSQDGLDYEVEDNGQTFTAYKRGYYSQDNFEVRIIEEIIKWEK